MFRQDINSKSRTISRNNKNYTDRKNKTPFEVLSSSISEICMELDNQFFREYSQLIRQKQINYDHNLINQHIENNFSETHIESLNPAALVAGFMVLGKNYIIDSEKVNFVFTKELNRVKIMNFFKDKKVKEEDIIRYARLWNFLLKK
jgi:hypothetical protein